MEQKIVKALEIIEGLDWETVECGRYDVDDELYYMVQEYETKYPEQARYEAHKKYVDIQYIVKGIERMEFAETPALCIYYRGPYEGIATAIRALAEYTKENNIEITGAFRSIYLEGPPNRGNNSEDYITQIVVPVKV